MAREKEEWRDIIGYEGMYEVSNFGRVKSLRRKVRYKNSFRTIKEKIMSPGWGTGGYQFVRLSNDGVIKIFRVHILVWEHFGDGQRNGRLLQVDHKDNDKRNNNIDNLQLLTNRQNVSKYHNKTERTSKYIGVCWCKDMGKWVAHIYMNNKNNHLGYFKKELDAYEAYKKALGEL